MTKKLTEAERFERFLEANHKKVRGSPKCPRCKGEGYTTRKVFAGNDSYDEPRYRQTIDPCTECRETVTRIKRKYR